jgi:hypothetical protein
MLQGGQSGTTEHGGCGMSGKKRGEVSLQRYAKPRGDFRTGIGKIAIWVEE